MSDLTKIKTPVGELYYVNISGQGKLNYNEDGYNYVATLYLEGEKAAELRVLYDSVLGKIEKGEILKSKGYRELLQDDEGKYIPTGTTAERDKEAKPTGIFAFSFSTRTTLSTGQNRKINVYNSANPPSKVNLGERKIGNGSLGIISGSLQRYEAKKNVGVTSYLNAIQLVKFIEYTGDDGFEAVEGGFIGDEGIDVSSMEAEVTTTEEQTSVKPKL